MSNSLPTLNQVKIGGAAVVGLALLGWAAFVTWRVYRVQRDVVDYGLSVQERMTAPIRNAFNSAVRTQDSITTEIRDRVGGAQNLACEYLGVVCTNPPIPDEFPQEWAPGEGNNYEPEPDPVDLTNAFEPTQ